MNGPHDLGGAQGFGSVIPEENEPVFHAEWEKRAFALTLAMGATGTWNLDQSRQARESLAPAQYLASSYYEIWFQALANMLRQHGLANDTEIETGKSSGHGESLNRILHSDEVVAALGRGGPVVRPQTKPARFAAGERVVAKRINPTGHTRLPRYARGRVGTISRVHGVHVFADAHAAGKGEDPQWLYSVAFEAKELWGPDTTASSIHVDLWEPYLEPAKV